jgi:hypothetical protein
MNFNSRRICGAAVLLVTFALACPGAAIAADSAKAITLLPGDAKLHGKHISLGRQGTVVQKWDSVDDSAEWAVTVPADGWYAIELQSACIDGCGGKFEVTVGGQTLAGTVKPTLSWFDFQTAPVGAVHLPAGPTTLNIRATQVQIALMNVKSVRLTPTTQPPPPPAAPAGPTKARLVATWRSAQGVVTQTLTLRADATYTMEILVPNLKHTMTGTWKLDGTNLVQKVTECENPAMIGQEHSMIVKDVTDEQLVLVDPDKGDHPLTLTRVPAPK